MLLCLRKWNYNSPKIKNDLNNQQETKEKKTFKKLITETFGYMLFFNATIRIKLRN